MILIIFSRKGATYRMRVARVHVHPGETDRVEMQGRDMLGDVAWTSTTNDKVPSAEWLIRRALWHVLENGPDVEQEVHLGEV